MVIAASVQPMDAELVDLRDAARQLAVHYQTAYRWVRSGELPATKVMGAYRLDSDVVARLAERRARATPTRPRRPRAGFAALSTRMFGYLVAGEERQARQLTGGLLDNGVSLTTVAMEVLVPALRRIGEEWQAGQLGVPTEHRASAIGERILGERHPNPRGRRRGTAAVAAISGERHALPTTLAAGALLEDNWRVHHLGADLPPDQLIRFCQEEHVDLAVLSVTTAKARPAAARVATRLEDLGLRTLVGCPGTRLEDLQRLARQA